MTFTDPLGLAVINDSSETVWVKEEDSDAVHGVRPGDAWREPQDGLTLPGRKCVVYKTTNDVDIWIHCDGTIDRIPRGFGAGLVQRLRGGEKGVEWLTGELWPAGDHGWDKLFEKAGVDLAKPECCEE